MRYVLLNLAFLYYALFGGKPEAASEKAERLTFLRGADTLRFANASHVVHAWKKEFAVVSGDSIYFTKGSLVTKAFEAPRISSVIFAADTLWLGTARGLFYILRTEDGLHPLPIPAREAYPAVNDLAHDAKGRLWIATEKFGLFAFTGGSVRPYPTSPEVLSLAVTPDGSVWAGSNIGLFHIFPGGEIRRYYEEITGQGIAIPDNIVEKLRVDADRNLWIFMSQAVSVLTPSSYDSAAVSREDVDPASFDFTRNNAIRIRSLAQRQPHKPVWWAGTDEGIYVVSGIEINGHEEENNDRIEPKGNSKLISSFETTKGSVHIGAVSQILTSSDGSLLVASQSGIWKLSRELAASYEKRSEEATAKK